MKYQRGSTSYNRRFRRSGLASAIRTAPRRSEPYSWLRDFVAPTAWQLFQARAIARFAA